MSDEKMGISFLLNQSQGSDQQEDQQYNNYNYSPSNSLQRVTPPPSNFTASTTPNSLTPSSVYQSSPNYYPEKLSGRSVSFLSSCKPQIFSSPDFPFNKAATSQNSFSSISQPSYNNLYSTIANTQGMDNYFHGFNGGPQTSYKTNSPITTTPSGSGQSSWSSKPSKEERKRKLEMAAEDFKNGKFKNIHSAASYYKVNYNSLKNAVYKISGKDDNSQRLTTYEREIRIEKAINGYKDGRYNNLTEASKMEKVCAETVRNRYHGRTQSFHDAKRSK